MAQQILTLKPPTHDGKIIVNGGSVEFTVISTEQINKNVSC